MEHNYILTNSTQTRNSKVDTYTCDGCNDTYTKTTEITPDYIAQGTCGENASWTLDKDGLLTISGTGKMENYNCPVTTPPWAEYDIKSAFVDEGITSIGAYAFSDLLNVTNVSLPSTVTEINYGAFMYCVSLTDITLPDGITSIAPNCFYMTGLSSISIPEGVTTIEGHAFTNTPNLKDIYIPSSVTYISTVAFNHCGDGVETRYHLSPNNQSYVIYDGVLFTKDMSTLVTFLNFEAESSYTIPDTVSTIGVAAFLQCNIAGISIPERTSKISEEAFLLCANLTDISLPHSLTEVGWAAFDDTSLVNVSYNGTKQEWTQINIHDKNDPLTNATIHFLRSSEPAQGQTNISCLVQEITVGETAPVNVNVYLEESDVFAAAEIVLQFDDAKLQFNEEASTLNGASVKVENGLLTLENYGTDKSCGVGSYVLSFDALTDGEAQVTLVSAAFSEKENAVHSDLVVSQVSETGLTLIVQRQSVSVTLPEIFTGPTSVTLGQDYTFRAADSIHFDYAEISAIMGGESAVITDNQDGTYTIAAVSGPIVITGTRAAKQYSVSFAGNGAEDITDGAASAVYGTDYSFTMPSALGWSYHLESITVNGVALTEYSVESSVYTIPGNAITGAVIITVNKEQAEVTVTVEGSGASAAEGYFPSVQIGTDYTLTLHPLAGYQYTVTAAMGGETVEVTDNSDNTYTVASVTADLVFTVERQVITTGLKVSKFLTLDRTNMWLILNQTGTAENNVPTYDGQPMYYSEKYQAYCWLVIAPTLETEEAESKLGFTIGETTVLEEDMDVNRSGKVDANDAQLVYNMYNTMYDAFTNDVTVQKFLLADVNGDSNINVADAAAIVESLLN